MSNYDDLMQQIKNGQGCDDCPLYHNGFCNNELEEHEDEGLDCGEILYRFLNSQHEKPVATKEDAKNAINNIGGYILDLCKPTSECSIREDYNVITSYLYDEPLEEVRKEWED